MPFRAILFDVDGTLVDSVDQHAAAWVDAFAEFGHPVTFDDVRAQIGKGGDQLMPVFVPREELEARGKDLEHRRGEIFREHYLPNVKPLPGARDLLRRCRAVGLRVILASSAKAEELAALKDILGLSPGDIDAETCADDAERSKPYPDIFLSALHATPDLGAGEAVAVGDTPYDAEAAGKAGIATIGVLSGGFPEASLRGAGCFAIYRGPDHLLAEFDASPLMQGRAA